MAKQIGTNIEGRAVRLHSKSGMQRDNVAFDSPFTGKSAITKKFALNNAKASVDMEIKETVKDLYNKRERLKDLLDSEEKYFFFELNQQTVAAKKERLKQKQTIEDEIEIARKKREEEMLAKKKLELDMVKCAEIKNVLSKRREKEIKMYQRMQIDQKNDIKYHENELEKSWHKILLADAEARKKIEEERMSREQKMKSTLKSFLDSQVELALEAKKQSILRDREEEMKQCAELLKVIDQKILNENQEKKKSQMILESELSQQIAMARKKAEVLKKQSNELENSIIVSSLAEYEEDKRKKLKIKEEERKEIDKFNKHLSIVKNNRKVRDKKYETLISEALDEISFKSEERMHSWNNKRKSLLKAIVNERNKQMQQKRDMDNLNNKSFAVECLQRKENEQNIFSINREEKEAIEKGKLEYKKFLQNQIKTQQKLKHIEKEKQEAERRQMLLEEIRMKEKCADLLTKDFNSESTHPFAGIIKKSAKSHTSWYSFVPETKYFKY